MPTSPELHLAGFDGPMDLLLDLAERQRIDLGRISMLELTEQFITISQQMQRHVPLERRADWLVVATRLLLLRSRLLFPASPAAQAEAAAEAGLQARRLDQMGAVRRLAGWLDARPQLEREVFTRRFGKSPRVVSYMALMEACLSVLRGLHAPDAMEVAPYRTGGGQLFRVADAMARIRSLVALRPGEAIAFDQCLPAMPRIDGRHESNARSAVASSLVAVLELVRGGELVATQADPVESISIRSP